MGENWWTIFLVMCLRSYWNQKSNRLELWRGQQSVFRLLFTASREQTLTLKVKQKTLVKNVIHGHDLLHQSCVCFGYKIQIKIKEIKGKTLTVSAGRQQNVAFILAKIKHGILVTVIKAGTETGGKKQWSRAFADRVSSVWYTFPYHQSRHCS